MRDYKKEVVKLMKRNSICRDRYEKNLFRVRVVNLWNSLPEEMMSADFMLTASKDDLTDIAWEIVSVKNGQWTVLQTSERLQTHLCEKTSQQATTRLIMMIMMMMMMMIVIIMMNVSRQTHSAYHVFVKMIVIYLFQNIVSQVLNLMFILCCTHVY